MCIYNFYVNYKEESGKRLKAAREGKGYTLKSLAAHIPGFSPSRIGNYEQGKRYMDPETTEKLSKILDVSMAFLMAVDDDLSMTPSEKALITKFRSTDERGKRVIQSVADAQPVNIEGMHRTG